MSILIKADKIQVGQMVSTLPKEVCKVEKTSSTITVWVKVNDIKTAYIGYPKDSFLEVHERESEAAEMPDDSELIDRVVALLFNCVPKMHCTSDALDAITHLVQSEVFDIPRLMDITNDFGPFLTDIRPEVILCEEKF